MVLVFDAACEAGLDKALADGPASGAELASRLELDAHAVRVVLECLELWSLVERDAEGRFHLGSRWPEGRQPLLYVTTAGLYGPGALRSTIAFEEPAPGKTAANGPNSACGSKPWPFERLEEVAGERLADRLRAQGVDACLDRDVAPGAPPLTAEGRGLDRYGRHPKEAQVSNTGLA